MENNSFLLGKRNQDFVSFTPIEFSHPRAEQAFDRTWIQTQITIGAGSFKGDLKGEFQEDDFIKLLNELIHLKSQLAGQAQFKPREPWAKIHIQGDGIGHFLATVNATDKFPDGAQLKFEISFDQTELDSICKSLKLFLSGLEELKISYK